DLVGLRRSSLHPAAARAMQRQQSLLLGAFDWYKAHARPRYRLANGLRVVAIILVALDVRFDEARRHELDRVSQFDELARPVMCAPASFHADQAGGSIGEELQELSAFQLPAQQHLATLVHSMDMKYALCQVDADRRNLHADAPPRLSGRIALPLWHIDAVTGGERPCHQGVQILPGAPPQQRSRFATHLRR